MKNVITIFIIIFGFINLNGQNEYIVKGTIKEQLTDEPLITAKIHFNFDSLTIGTITEIDGSFELKTIHKPDTIIIKYAGYETRRIKTNFDNRNEMYIDVVLKYSKNLSTTKIVLPKKESIKWEKKSKNVDNVLLGKWRAMKFHAKDKKYSIKKLNKNRYSYFEIEFKSRNEFNLRYKGNWTSGVKYILTSKDELEFKHIGLKSILLPPIMNQNEIFTAYDNLINKMIISVIKYKTKRKKLILILNGQRIIYIKNKTD